MRRSEREKEREKEMRKGERRNKRLKVLILLDSCDFFVHRQ